MAELKPCPFCGGKADMVQPGTSRHSCIVECRNCGCRLESGDEGKHSGQSWNSRVPDGVDLPAGADLEALARQADCTHIDLDGDRAKALERLAAFASLVRSNGVRGDANG